MAAVTRRQVATGAAALAAILPGATGAQERVQFPFRVTRNRPWAAVAIDRKPAAPFLLDMGSDGFLIDDDYAASLGLPYAGDIDHVQTAGGDTRLRSYQVDELVVGGRVREQGLTIGGWRPAPGKLVKGLVPTTHLGVIGFDFDAQTITAERALRQPPEGYEKIELGNRRTVGPNSYLASRNIDQTVIFAAVDGRELRVIVDTGASDSLFLFPATVRALGLWDRNANYIPGRTSTIAGPTDKRQVRIGSLKVGGFVFDRPVISLADPASAGGIADEADGLLGVEVLRRLNFILDQDRRALWVRPSKAVGDVYRYNRAGVLIEAQAGDLRVVRVDAGLPGAEAGIRVGDKVTGWAGEGGYFGLLWALEGAPGQVVRVQIERDGAPRVLDIILQERL